MKIIIALIFRTLFAIILIVFAIWMHFFLNVIEIFWDFKTLKWADNFNNSHCFNQRKELYDNNVIETFIRYYKLNLY